MFLILKKLKLFFLSDDKYSFTFVSYIIDLPPGSVFNIHLSNIFPFVTYCYHSPLPYGRISSGPL